MTLSNFKIITAIFSGVRIFRNFISNCCIALAKEFYIVTSPLSHDCRCFEQFDWLKEKFYTSINSVSKNRGTIFLPLTLKWNFDDKFGIIRNELIILWILSMCKLHSQSQHKALWALLSLWVIHLSLHIDKIHKNDNSFLIIPTFSSKSHFCWHYFRSQRKDNSSQILAHGIYQSVKHFFSSQWNCAK